MKEIDELEIQAEGWVSVLKKMSDFDKNTIKNKYAELYVKYPPVINDKGITIDDTRIEEDLLKFLKSFFVYSPSRMMYQYCSNHSISADGTCNMGCC